MITLVVARADNGVIGRDGQLPWHIPEDLRRFKALTLGKPVIMGRRTWTSIGRPLPGRHNIVLTRQPDFIADGATVAASLDAALAAAGNAPDIAVIGGANVYAQALRHAGRIELTEVHAAPDGDTTLPAFEPASWREVARERHPGHSFVTLERG